MWADRHRLTTAYCIISSVSSAPGCRQVMDAMAFFMTEIRALLVPRLLRLTSLDMAVRALSSKVFILGFAKKSR